MGRNHYRSQGCFRTKRTKWLTGADMRLIRFAGWVMLCGHRALPGAPGPPGKWVTRENCRLQRNEFNASDSPRNRFAFELSSSHEYKLKSWDAHEDDQTDPSLPTI